MTLYHFAETIIGDKNKYVGSRYGIYDMLCVQGSVVAVFVAVAAVFFMLKFVCLKFKLKKRLG